MNSPYNAQEITRVLFQDFPGWMLGTFYVVAIAAMAVFAYGVYMRIRKYRRGTRSGVWNDLRRRFLAMLEVMATHRTLRRRDEKAGRAHAMIFFSFVLLFIGTATITLEYDILEPLTGLRFWYGNFYLLFSLVLDVAGVALIGGLLYMMYRRKWLKLPKLDYTRPDRKPEDPDYDRSFYRIEDWAFLWSLILIAISGFILEALRVVWLQDNPAVWDHRWWAPMGAFLAHVFSGLGLTPEGAGTARLFMWWGHGVLALTFIASIPYTKIIHIFTASASLMARDPLAAQRLPKVDLEGEKIGYRDITDFNDKQLLHLDACTKCGRCHEACPARAVGFPLSPRDLILTLREFSNSTLNGAKVPEAEALNVHGTGVNQVRAETLWSCRTCMACVEICPVGIEHVPIIVQLRRYLVDQGEMDPMLQSVLQNIQKRGNSFGETKRKRPAWTKKLDFEIKDARKEETDLLWFVGDYASFDPRNQKVSQAFAKILREAGVDFGILYEDEQNAGNEVRRVGEEGLYELLAENNIKLFKKAQFKKIITTDPHSFNTIKNEYPEFGGAYEIEHHSQLLKRLLDEGRIKIRRKLNYRVTYHDPCHLGRFNKVFDAPREILKALGCELIDLARSRDNSFCCGAGGGRIFMADPLGQEKPSENRMKEAGQIPDLNVFVVACPKDVTMFEDALKTVGFEGKFVVRDLNELVLEAMALEEKTPEQPLDKAAATA